MRTACWAPAGLFQPGGSGIPGGGTAVHSHAGRGSVGKGEEPGFEDLGCVSGQTNIHVSVHPVSTRDSTHSTPSWNPCGDAWLQLQWAVPIRRALATLPSPRPLPGFLWCHRSLLNTRRATQKGQAWKCPWGSPHPMRDGGRSRSTLACPRWDSSRHVPHCHLVGPLSPEPRCPPRSLFICFLPFLSLSSLPPTS